MGICTSSYKKNNKIQPLVIPNDEEVVEICYHGRPRTNDLNNRIVQDIGNNSDKFVSYNIKKGQEQNQTISECDYYDL
jgi:hypothetical protein